MNLEALKTHFPREAISWRAQSVTKDGTKAMALAYIDARDVMNRLDEAVGPENWQDEYVETAKGRVICRIGVFIGKYEEQTWVWKSDGAGDTDVEGDKGAISDSFKRAAVKWGIGRYLYDMPTPWVPCDTYQNAQGRHVWKAWKDDPWKYVKKDRVVKLGPTRKKHEIINTIRSVVNLEDLKEYWQSLTESDREDDDIFAEKENRKAELAAALMHQGAG